MTAFDPEKLKQARAIASEAIEKYGDFVEADWERFRKNGIWNDHVAVQAVLLSFERGFLSPKVFATLQAKE